MNTLYIIAIIFFLSLSLTCGFALYRLNLTILLATISNVDYTSKPDKCTLTISYSISGTNITSKITTPSTIQWAAKQTIPIYINPLDLSSPKYAPKEIFTILYICTCVGLIGLVLGVYFSVKNGGKDD